MKKIILLFIATILLCGCTKIENQNLEKIISETINSDIHKYNTYRRGFKYYLPARLNVEKANISNVIIKDNKNKYYMYIDMISYFNKTKKEIKFSDDLYYSKDLSNNDCQGYIKIKTKNDKYLIEIMYNYATIEVIVDEPEIAISVANSLIILSSIKYNDDVISNMLEEDILNYSEENFSLFDEDGNDSNFLDVVQEYDNYDKEILPDYDLIN